LVCLYRISGDEGAEERQYQLVCVSNIVVFFCIAEQGELKWEGGRTRRGKWKGWVTPEMPTRTVLAVCCPATYVARDVHV
jgi:hypothetical protein